MYVWCSARGPQSYSTDLNCKRKSMSYSFSQFLYFSVTRRKNVDMPQSKGSKSDMAWSANNRHHHLRCVFPPSGKGMQASLHQDAIKGLQPNVINDPEDYVYAARRIFHR